MIHFWQAMVSLIPYCFKKYSKSQKLFSFISGLLCQCLELVYSTTTDLEYSPDCLNLNLFEAKLLYFFFKTIHVTSFSSISYCSNSENLTVIEFNLPCTLLLFLLDYFYILSEKQLLRLVKLLIWCCCLLRSIFHGSNWTYFRSGWLGSSGLKVVSFINFWYLFQTGLVFFMSLNCWTILCKKWHGPLEEFFHRPDKRN